MSSWLDIYIEKIYIISFITGYMVHDKRFNNMLELRYTNIAEMSIIVLRIMPTVYNYGILQNFRSTLLLVT